MCPSLTFEDSSQPALLRMSSPGCPSFIPLQVDFAIRTHESLSVTTVFHPFFTQIILGMYTGFFGFCLFVFVLLWVLFWFFALFCFASALPSVVNCIPGRGAQVLISPKLLKLIQTQVNLARRLLHRQTHGDLLISLPSSWKLLGGPSISFSPEQSQE